MSDEILSFTVEVLHFLAFNELPKPYSDILGMMRIREFVVAVIDLRLRFGLPAEYSLTTPIIVMNTATDLIGLIVDDVDDIVCVDHAQIMLHGASTSRYISGVARVSSQLLLLLDVSLLRAENETL